MTPEDLAAVISDAVHQAVQSGRLTGRGAAGHPRGAPPAPKPEQIAPLIAQVRVAGGPEPLEAVLRDWHGRLSARGRAMPTGAAELEAYLRERG